MLTYIAERRAWIAMRAWYWIAFAQPGSKVGLLVEVS